MTVFEYERRAVLGSDARDAAAYYGCPETLPAFADEMRAVAVGEKSDAVDEHEAAVFAAVVISHVEPAHRAGAEPRKDFSAFVRFSERLVRAGRLECVHHELEVSAAGVDNVRAHERIVYVLAGVRGVGELEYFNRASELFEALPYGLVALGVVVPGSRQEHNVRIFFARFADYSFKYRHDLAVVITAAAECDYRSHSSSVSR